MQDAVFSRGQVIQALWPAFGPDSNSPQHRAEVPPTFVTRVRKLGEFGIPDVKRPGQHGVFIEYTAYDAFEIGIGLDLQDTGFNQAEVGFFVGHARPKLRQAFEYVCTNPAPMGGFGAARDKPSMPVRLYFADGDSPHGLGDARRVLQADHSVFLSFAYHSVREAWEHWNPKDVSGWNGKGTAPLFLRLKLLFGLRQIAEELDLLTLRKRDRTRVVLELGSLAALVLEGLRTAQASRRGPS
jgi:hypothetical protein